MKNLEVSLTTTQENYKTLFKLGLNKDVIQIIYTFKKNIEYEENQLYHMNRLINKTKSFNINIINDEIIYDEYFRYCIPRNNGIEWCIKHEHDRIRDFLINRIDLIFEPGFMIEKIERKIFENKDIENSKLFEKYWNNYNPDFIQSNYVYFEPKIFRKIKTSNHLNDSEILEMYEENEVYIYTNYEDYFNF